MEEYVPPRDIVNGVAVDKAVFVPAVILKGGSEALNTNKILLCLLNKIKYH